MQRFERCRGWVRFPHELFFNRRVSLIFRTCATMTEKIYVLSYFGYEEYDPVFLQGPEVNDWELYVSQFEKEALQKANVSLQRKNKKME